MFTELSRKDITLRPYQQNAKELIFSAWDQCDNVMFQMPTGTGKTRLFTSIISDIKAWSILTNQDSKILIIAHRVELIDQISESLDKYKVTHGIIVGGKERNLRPQVQVASIQTITHRTNIDVASSLNVDYIIIDEAHHSIANSYKKLWSLYPNSKKLGVTATPWRMSHQGFTSLYNKLIVSDSIKTFIQNGWLAPYSYYSIGTDSSISKGIKSIDEFDIEGDYKISALENAMDNYDIRAQLLSSYLSLAQGKKGIIYSISRKHSDHICSEFRAAGVNIVRIDSETPREERRLYVQRFKNGQIDIIVNVDIFSEGFDCPDIEFIQLARPTRSLVKYLQQVGRGLRPTEGKSKCIILDNVGAHCEFGFPDSDRDWDSSFIGEQISEKKTERSSHYHQNSTREQSYSEGDETMCLVEDIPSSLSSLSINSENSWNEDDDVLLKTLLIDKHCDIMVLCSVFKASEETIRDRCKALSIDI